MFTHIKSNQQALFTVLENNLQFSFPGFRIIHQWPYVLCSVVVCGILIHPSLTHQCDSIQFFKETGYALEGHVIESTSSHFDDCLWRCRANAECFSINVKKVRKEGVKEGIKDCFGNELYRM